MVPPVRKVKYTCNPSPLQEGFLFHSMIQKRSSLYIGQIFYRINGDLKVEAIKEAYAILVQRHDALRTVFEYRQDGKPVQVVMEDGATDVVYSDLRDVDNSETRDNIISEYKRKDIERGFDLSSDMLFRVCIFQLADELFELVWTWHHIVIDGWSLGILQKEFAVIYDAIVFRRSSGLPAAVPYREFIRYLEQHEEGEAGRFWDNYLRGYGGVTSIPRSYADTGSQDYAPVNMLVPVSSRVNEGLYELSRNNRVTLNTVLQAIYGILLAKYTDRKDVVFGTVVSGRPVELDEVESIVGLFINTLPVRVRIDDDTSFGQLLSALKKHALDMDPYQIIQLADIQSENNGKQKLFEHLLVFENYPMPQDGDMSSAEEGAGTGFSSLSFSDMGYFDHSHYDLGLVITSEGSIEIKISFNSNVYSPEFARELGNNLIHLAVEAMTDPGKPLSQFSLLAPERLHRNNNAGDRNAYRPEKTLVEALEQSIRTVGDKDALFFNGHTWSYRQLNERVNRIAHHLRDNCDVRPGDMVGLLLDRTDDLVVSLLAVLKAGGAYLPLDPEYPLDRIRFILKDAGPKVVITLTDHMMKLEEYEGTVFVVDMEAAHLTTSGDDPALVNRPEDLAYCLYTSGTTGMPKGSLVQHHSMVNLTAGMYDPLGVEDYLRVAVVSPAVFDPFGQKLFIALLNGHCVYLVPDTIKKSRAIFDYFKTNEIDMIDGTQSYMQLLLDICPEGAVLPRYWLLGGEVMPGHLALSLYEKSGDHRDKVVLLNEYGLTECSVASSFLRVDFDKVVKSEPVPIGRPILNHEMYVLDDRLNFLPDGAIGEIAIAGPGVGLGYLNRPELTAEKFVTLPSGEQVFRTGDMGRYLPDGNLLCLGRKDRQLKLHGYRIELGEIESALKKGEDVRDVFIMCREDTSGVKYLAAYYTTFGNKEIKDVKAYLQTLLPQYMIPSYILHLASFPLNANGKIDATLLPDPLTRTENRETIVGPRNETEEWLMQVWQEVLGKQQISVKDDFFEIGGHSLRGVQVIFRIQKEYLVPISMTMLFMHPTIETLAREIDSMAVHKHAADVVVGDQTF